MDSNASAICAVLIDRQAVITQSKGIIEFVSNSQANALLNDLDVYPHAFVLACLMDRQQKAEKCWTIPYHFQQKLGTLDFKTLATLSQEQIAELMSKPEALHRFADIMAHVFYKGVQRISTQYAGDASQIWKGTPSSATIVKRFLEFDGAGPKIATMAANILVREFRILVSDTISIDISVDVQVRRVFQRLGFVRTDASNEEIIYTARELNPSYPGIFDLPAWEIGRNWCRPQNPECSQCYVQQLCPAASLSQQ